MIYLALLIILAIVFYTVLFGIETWKEKNYLGSLAIIFLAVTIFVLPFYMLFFRV